MTDDVAEFQMHFDARRKVESNHLQCKAHGKDIRSVKSAVNWQSRIPGKYCRTNVRYASVQRSTFNLWRCHDIELYKCDTLLALVSHINLVDYTSTALTSHGWGSD